MKRPVLSFIISLLSATALGQEPLEPIETDRPDQTESPSIVPKRWLQFEAGLQRQVGEDVEYTLPTLLSKYGVSKKLELRLVTEHMATYEHRFTDSLGLLPVLFGFKHHLFDEKGLRPQTSLIAHLGFNDVASKYFKDYTFLAPEFRFTMQHTLTHKLGLGYNLGAAWEQTNGAPEWIYTLAPGMELGEKWYTYVEVFGSVRRHERPEHNVDGGIAYNPSPNIRVDISGGVGLTQKTFDHYIAVGFSMRVPTYKLAVH